MIYKGVSLPFPDIISECLSRNGVAPGLPPPNSFRLLLCAYILFKLKGWDLTFEHAKVLFQLKGGPGGQKDEVLLQAWPGLQFVTDITNPKNRLKIDSGMGASPLEM